MPSAEDDRSAAHEPLRYCQNYFDYYAVNDVHFIQMGKTAGEIIGSDAYTPKPVDQLRLVRLQRYFCYRDWEWLRARDRAAARQRWWWCYGQFASFCLELQREQRVISRERSLAQCASVGELLRLELEVNLRIAELFWLGSVYFAGVPSDTGRIVQRYLGLGELMHPAVSAGNAPA